MSKDVFLSNVANKQNFIDMLSHYLQHAGCLTEHAEEDADQLIAQTVVQSAATKNTVLVAASGISKLPKVSWVLTSATTSCSYTRYWGVTPHPDYMISEKDSPPVRCSEIKLNLTVLQPDYMISEKDSPPVRCSEIRLNLTVLQEGCNSWRRHRRRRSGTSVCLYSGKEGDNLDDLMNAQFCDKVATNKVRIRPQTMPRPLQQRDTTAREYTCSYISGWVSAIWRRQIGGGWQRTRTSSLLWQTFLQHQTSCSVSSDATAQLIAAQPDAVVASTVWSVPLHAVSAEVSDVPTAPRLI